MLSSVFIKTYFPDLRWLEWCLRFLDQNWHEISTLSIMAPPACCEKIMKFKCELGPQLIPMDEWGTEGYHPNESHVPGYLGQQYFKMVADLYCEGDFITFIDSDCMLFKRTLLSDLCDSSGRPIIWYTPHSVLGNTVPWRAIVRDITLIEPELEFMRCHPFTYRRETLKNCREWLEQLHNTDLRTIMRGRTRWSEFNILGFYAYIFEEGNYDFRDTESRAADLQKWSRIRQFFSYGDWNDQMPAYLSKLLNGEPEPVIEIKETDDAQLFICTWEKDLDWLEYALKSIAKYWKSSFGTLIAATPECKQRIEQQMMPDAVIRYEPKMTDHHRGQIYLKLTMDLLGRSDVDAMICMDSDCMFTRESRYQDFCVDGKPIIHCENYETLIPRSIPQDQNCFCEYRKLVKELLDIDAPAEYMRQHPFVFFKDTIARTRSLIEKRMSKPLLEVMEERYSGYFSEFNLLGAYAAFHEPKRYHVAPVEAVEDRRVHQFHSWSQTPQNTPLAATILNAGLDKPDSGTGVLPVENNETDPRPLPVKVSTKRRIRKGEMAAGIRKSGKSTK